MWIFFQVFLIFYGKSLVFSYAQTTDENCNPSLVNTTYNSPQNPCKMLNKEKSDDSNDATELFLSVALIVGISSILMCICCLSCKIISKAFENRRLNIQNPQLNIANRQGITKDMIDKAYPIEKYKDGTSIKGEPTCTICLVDFSEGENIRKTNCLHTFHAECLDEWLFSQNSPRCPNCNKILFDQENHIV